MGRIKRWIGTLSKKLDLPQDVTVGLPCILMTGFCECTMDSHRGILEYSDTKITAALSGGSVAVEGTGLEIRLMHRDRLTITGRIEKLTFLGGTL